MAHTLASTGGNSLERTVFEAIPIPVFVVDDDTQVLDRNHAAAQFCADLQLTEVRDRRGGHVLHCVHSTDVPEGCGRGPACKSCVIRTSVASSLSGRTISRKRMNLRVRQEEKTTELQVLVTACPMPEGAEARALLMVEDITHLATLKNLIPICVKCKSVRQDEEYWQSLESYVHNHMGVDFSHGVCPECVNDFYPEYRRQPEAPEL